MNWVDIVIILVMVWFIYSAFNAGVIREVITIVGAIFAVALAGLFYTRLARDINVAVSDPGTSRVIAFIIILGAVVLASQLTAIFLKEAASLLMLGLFDSLAGAVIGLVKGFVFVEIGLIIAVTFPQLHLEKAVHDSLLAPFFLESLPVLTKILPGEFKNAVKAF